MNVLLDILFCTSQHVQLWKCMQINPFQPLNQNVRNILNYHRRLTNYSGSHLNEYLLKNWGTFVEHLFYKPDHNIYKKYTWRHFQINIESALGLNTRKYPEKNPNGTAMGKYDLTKLEKRITTMYVLPFMTVWVDPGVRLISYNSLICRISRTK